LFFLELQAKGLIGSFQVFIVPSLSGHPELNVGAADILNPRGHARFAGRLTGLSSPASNTPGHKKHPVPACRPASTVSGSHPDFDWEFFWEVSDLVPCLVPLSAFVKHSTKAKFASGFMPEGPTLVRTLP
jgi:hypothetical protein